MALEVERHAFGEPVTAHQGLHHTNHLGTFFVNGDGVEVVDFQVLVGSHRVRHGAGIFGELGGAQHAHIFNALDRARRVAARQVLAELLIAKDGQAFLERELEPVAAGHAVAAPVVEVLVAHHAFDVGVIHIGGGGLIGQHVLGVEDVEALVFHGAHVEVAGGDNHEALQIQAQAKARLVPGDARHEGVHRVFGLVEVAGAHIHLQHMLAARARADALLAAHQQAGHQGKQIAGLFVRVDPAGKVAALGQFAVFHQVAVGQQHRKLRAVGAQGDAVARHHIGAVQEVGDATKALGLALGEERPVADIQPHELAVLGRVAGGEDFQLEGLVALGQLFQHQPIAVHLERGALAVDQHAREVELFAVEPQGLRGHVGVAAHAHLVEHAGLGRVEVEGEVDGVDEEGGGLVVLAADRRGGLGVS